MIMWTEKYFSGVSCQKNLSVQQKLLLLKCYEFGGRRKRPSQNPLPLYFFSGISVTLKKKHFEHAGS